jgi:arsenate reductase
MAAAFFNRLADVGRARAVSAGTAPAERIHPAVVTVMDEIGIHLADTPRPLTPELAAASDLLVTMGCGEACPVVPRLAVEDWALEDPAERLLEEVREIRDQIRERVAALVERRGLSAVRPGGSDRPREPDATSG